jgi:hypothetical protein
MRKRDDDRRCRGQRASGFADIGNGTGEVVVKSHVATASLIEPIQQIVRKFNSQVAMRFTTMK